MKHRFSTAQTDWIEALESGRYSQTHTRLRDEDGFCCLGLACDRYDAHEWHEINPGEWAFVDPAEEDLRATEELPHRVQDRLEMWSSTGQFSLLRIPADDPDFVRIRDRSGSNAGDCNLAQLNDGGWTFAEIAALVRRHPRLFFYAR